MNNKLPEQNNEGLLLEQLSHGDRKAKVEEVHGGKRYSVRVERPYSQSLEVKTASERMSQHQTQGAKIAEVQDKMPDEQFSYPDSKRDMYDYKKVFPYIGTPDSLPVEPVGPQLIMAHVRHLEHTNQSNVVPEEAKDAFRPRVSYMFEEMGIKPEDKVYVISSPAGQFATESGGEWKKHSRTIDTASVIIEEARKIGCNVVVNKLVEDDDRASDASISRIHKDITDFPVSVSEARYKEASRIFKENKAARAEGNPLPHPDAPKMAPYEYASYAKDVFDLESKTGMPELSAATVARGLDAFDTLEDQFLGKRGALPEKEKGGKIFVIVTGHGQFTTNITEGLFVATGAVKAPEHFPIVFAGNGSFVLVNAFKDKDGQVYEDYTVEVSDRVGTRKIV